MMMLIRVLWCGNSQWPDLAKQTQANPTKNPERLQSSVFSLASDRVVVAGVAWAWFYLVEVQS